MSKAIQTGGWAPVAFFPVRNAVGWILLGAIVWACSICSGTQPAASGDPVTPYLSLLSRVGANQALIQPVATFLKQDGRRPGLQQNGPALMVVRYRMNGTEVRKVVGQAFDQPDAAASSPRRARLTGRAAESEEFVELADKWNDLLTRSQCEWFGPANEVQVWRRGWQQMLSADPAFIREQIIEPLYLLVTMTEPGDLIPRSLRGRVKSVVVEAELTNRDWHGKVHLLAADEDTAAAVANVVEMWQELAASTLEIGGQSDARRAGVGSIRHTVTKVTGAEVLVEGSVPSNLGTRAATKALRWAFGQPH